MSGWMSECLNKERENEERWSRTSQNRKLGDPADLSLIPGEISSVQSSKMQILNSSRFLLPMDLLYITPKRTLNMYCSTIVNSLF